MPNSYIATKTNIFEQPWWIPCKNIQSNVLGCLQLEKNNKKKEKKKKGLIGKSEKVKMKKKARRKTERTRGKSKTEKDYALTHLKFPLLSISHFDR